MIVTARTALAAALAFLAATAQAAEGELWFRRSEQTALARGIRDRGFSCPEIRAVYFVGAKPDGNHMRAVCGSKDGAAPPSEFRLIVRGSGTFRAQPWAEPDPSSAAVAPSAGAFTLRTSLD